mgnify:CR=1 FL=1
MPWSVEVGEGVVVVVVVVVAVAVVVSPGRFLDLRGRMISQDTVLCSREAAACTMS